MKVKMSKVGEILRKRRELESMSLEDIATQTMIAKKYIIALEEGNFSPFPAQVYAKGFLRNYANFLGFDEEEINDLVSQYELEWKEANLELPISVPEKTTPTSKTNRSLYMIIFILIIGVSVLFFFYFAKQKTLLRQKVVNYPDPTKILEEEDIFKAENIIIKKKVEEAKKAKEKEIKKQPVAIKPKKVFLEAFASEKVWMQATIDGRRKHEVLLEPDQRIRWQANKKIFLTIGNAGGVVFKLNKRYIGALGRRGEVKKILVTAGGVEVIKTHETIQKKEPTTLSEKQVSTSSITTSGTSSQPTSTTIEVQQTTTTTLEIP
jgi:transcriptional regulator with XRE-family HTH domain